MHDAVYVLVEAFNKLLRKKPDMFRGGKKTNNGQQLTMLNNGSRIDCNVNKGWVTPWEHGDKISRFLRKVRLTISIFIIFNQVPAAFFKQKYTKPITHTSLLDRIRLNVDLLPLF